VIWSTGFRLDFGWIRLDLGPVNGYPEQTQGVSRHPGLYFMGLQLMHTRKSGLIFGVGEDAQHVTSAICRQLGLRPAAPAATVMPPTMSPPPTPSGRSSRSS
jgi:putative flavoprotein involved in K+ transport